MSIANERSEGDPNSEAVSFGAIRIMGAILAAVVGAGGYFGFMALFGVGIAPTALIAWSGTCVAGGGLGAYLCAIAMREDAKRRLLEFWFALSNFGVVAGGTGIALSVVKPPSHVQHATLMVCVGFALWFVLTGALGAYHFCTRNAQEV